MSLVHLPNLGLLSLDQLSGDTEAGKIGKEKKSSKNPPYASSTPRQSIPQRAPAPAGPGRGQSATLLGQWLDPPKPDLSFLMKRYHLTYAKIYDLVRSQFGEVSQDDMSEAEWRQRASYVATQYTDDRWNEELAVAKNAYYSMLDVTTQVDIRSLSPSSVLDAVNGLLDFWFRKRGKKEEGWLTFTDSGAATQLHTARVRWAMGNVLRKDFDGLMPPFPDDNLWEHPEKEKQTAIDGFSAFKAFPGRARGILKRETPNESPHYTDGLDVVLYIKQQQRMATQGKAVDNSFLEYVDFPTILLNPAYAEQQIKNLELTYGKFIKDVSRMYTKSPLQYFEQNDEGKAPGASSPKIKKASFLGDLLDDFRYLKRPSAKSAVFLYTESSGRFNRTLSLDPDLFPPSDLFKSFSYEDRIAFVKNVLIRNIKTEFGANDAWQRFRELDTSTRATTQYIKKPNERTLYIDMALKNIHKLYKLMWAAPPLERDICVVRSVKERERLFHFRLGDPAKYNAQSANEGLKVGDSFVDPTFLSTTVNSPSSYLRDNSSLMHFYNRENQCCLHFIYVKAGTRCLPLFTDKESMAYNDEGEIILPPLTRYTFMGYKQVYPFKNLDIAMFYGSEYSYEQLSEWKNSPQNVQCWYAEPCYDGNCDTLVQRPS